MLTIQRVLFTTDFSDGAARAFPRAAALAERHDAELHILNVTGSESETDRTLPVSLSILKEWLGSSSQVPETDLAALTIVQKQIEADTPSERIIGYVEDENIDLVVISTHGRRGVQRMLLGSVTEEVVRKAPCPVLTVRSDAEPSATDRVRRILVPVDFSDHARVALQHAKEIALTYGAEIHLLHVVEEVVYPSAYGVEPPLQPTQQTLLRVEKTLGTMAREELNEDHVHVSVKIGYAPLTILEYAHNTDIDLVVIATHGRTGLDRFLIGSVAQRVIRRSPTPVFVVKAHEKSLVPSSTVDAAPAHAESHPHPASS